MDFNTLVCAIWQVHEHLAAQSKRAVNIICNGGIGSIEDSSVGYGLDQYLCTLGSLFTTL